MPTPVHQTRGCVLVFPRRGLRLRCFIHGDHQRDRSLVASPLSFRYIGSYHFNKPDIRITCAQPPKKKYTCVFMNLKATCYRIVMVPNTQFSLIGTFPYKIYTFQNHRSPLVFTPSGKPICIISPINLTGLLAILCIKSFTNLAPTFQHAKDLWRIPGQFMVD